MTWTRVSWGGDIKFNTKDEKCAEVWLQGPLPLACSWLKPFRRPTTKGECESGMGGTIEGRGEHKLLKGHFQELSNLPCTYSRDQFQPRFPLCTPEKIFGYFCNLFWAISHCLLDDVRTYLFLPKNSPSRPPNFRNNTNIIVLNMLETPNVWIHSQHGASGFFFVLFCFSANEHATPREGKWLCQEEDSRAAMYISLHKSSYTSVCMCQVWNLIQGTHGILLILMGFSDPASPIAP